MSYTEKLQAMREEAIADLIKIHDKLVVDLGEPPMLVYKSDPNFKTYLYEIPVREYKTKLNKFTFKLSGLGWCRPNKLLTVNTSWFFVRGYSTYAGYKRIRMEDFETDMLMEFVDHLKNFYN